MEKKYRTEKDPETGLLRIIALKDFSDIKKGQRGGLISKEENLSQEGDCWIYYCARVEGNACVYEDARVFDDAIIYDNAWVGGNAKVYEGAVVREDTWIKENAEIYGDACVGGNTEVSGSAKICGHVEVCGDVEISGNIKLWSSMYVPIDTSIESNKDFIMFIQFITITKSKIAESYIFPSNIKEMISTTVNEENYVKNIQIIRQLYGEEI